MNGAKLVDVGGKNVYVFFFFLKMCLLGRSIVNHLPTKSVDIYLSKYIKTLYYLWYQVRW